MIREAIDTLVDALTKIPRPVMWGAVALVAVAALAIAVGVVGASSSGFLGGYQAYEHNYEALQTSLHSDVACNECHIDDRGSVVRQAALVGDFYRGIFEENDEPVYVDLATPSNDACLQCHYEDWSHEASRTTEIPHPAHLRVAEETRECVECHKWTAHEEEYIERHKTMPFSGVCASFGCHAGTKSVDECRYCHHAVQEEEPQWVYDHEDVVRSYGPNACLEACHDAEQCRQCHTTGVRPEFPEVGADPEVREIEHEHVQADWLETHGDWAIDDDSKCFVCHVSPAECEECHSRRPAFHGLESTWLNRHGEIAESEQDRRCLTCHEQEWCDECHEQFEETG
jgi:hypothetical protein